LSDPQLANSYNYGRDNPITQKDPDGKIVPLIMAAIEVYGAFTLGYSGGEVLNATMLFPNDYTKSDKNSALFNFGVNAVTTAAGPAAKLPYEKVILGLGPDVANYAGRFKNTGLTVPSPDYLNPLQQFTSNYPGLTPSTYRMINPRLYSSSIQERYKATQVYNSATGAIKSGGGTPSSSSLWVTPSGAVVTFGGQLVSAPPPSTTKKVN
jgi:hypothetical protein